MYVVISIKLLVVKNIYNLLMAANSERCTYINNQCKPSYAKLRNIEITARQLSNECHWNSNVMRCLDCSSQCKSNITEVVIVIESSISKTTQAIIMLIMVYIN
ncbi:unnamed protein product [Paramecium octaurelia]|uniref:Uncharacterized protein n=1 Tax=Paramecium octaurelia TaxID=43137 RepID=A0A8S1X4G6_PAROT|nr:unnamed protein product [Paramecium octaurelia]